MASPRDQLQAHQYLTQRVISALVTRESDPEQPPFRRPGVAAVGGLALAVVALAVVGIYGVVVPGGATGWRDGDAVVVEKETGTRFVYLDGRLHPVANYTSALLALGKHTRVRSVSRNSLLGVARGPRIGIPDAPDALPGPNRLLDATWTFCSARGTDRTGARVPESVLLVGHRPTTGDALADRALLAEEAGTGRRHLVLHGYRHEIHETHARAVEVALGTGPVVQFDPTVLDVLPAGSPIAPIVVPGTGRPSRAVPGRTDLRIGQVLVTTGSRGARYYLAEAGQLRPIDELQYDIQLAAPGTAAAYPAGRPAGVPLSLSEAAGAGKAREVPKTAGDPPAVRPEFVAGDPTATVCLVFDRSRPAPHVLVDPVLPAVGAMLETAGRTDRGTRLADRVLVPAGQVAVVESMPGPDAPAGTVLVVTDLGVGHPVAEPKVLEVLGLGGIRPARIPANLVARIPIGSGLSHESALRRTPT
ncbi:type VII secretion protein EccB [Plantactinospora sp. WMMB782]|uniref:type VII secretion protein EccB n=1 Tax=Plantactinospora sp. WMMB782 TaxID=3404121 RepID=UPI003B94C1FE